MIELYKENVHRIVESEELAIKLKDEGYKICDDLEAESENTTVDVEVVKEDNAQEAGEVKNDGNNKQDSTRTKRKPETK